MDFKVAQNFIFFQVGWWSTAVLVDNQLVVGALCVQGILLSLHIMFGAHEGEWAFILSVGALGFLLDFSYQTLGGFEVYPDLVQGFMPLWLIGIWFLFASTLEHSLKWMFTRPVIAALLGAVFGPLTYYIAGEQFGLLKFSEPLAVSLGIYAMVWGIFMLMVPIFSAKTIRKKNK